jgi:hypothetical protein
LRKLIEVKRGAGRPNDLEVIAELEELLDRTIGDEWRMRGRVAAGLAAYRCEASR